MNSRIQIRSFSLPSKLNPVNKRIEEELNKLRTKEASANSVAEKISIGLSGLTDLYTCINEVLSLPLTQQALSLRQHEKSVGELLKGCSNLHNVCSMIREIVVQQKRLAGDIQGTLHQSQHEGYESKVASYVSSRKEIIKKARGLIRSLKEVIDNDGERFEEQEPRLSTVITALTCVSIISMSVFESLLFYLSVPVSKPKSVSLVSKIIHKSRGNKSIHHQAKTGNNLMDVDIAIHSLCSRLDSVKIAEQRLDELVTVMEGFGNFLDSAYIQLTETKACLLNIVSF